MRNISQASLDLLKNKKGLEPINIVNIAWADNLIVRRYSDKPFISLGLEGKILDLSELENVIDFNRNGNSTSVKIKLDDSDGSIKAIFDNNNIHYRPVTIYQWFICLPLSEAFEIFSGVIVT